MRLLISVVLVAVCVFLVGCSEKKPPAGTLPQVTLTERSPKGSTILLRFCLSKLDRVDWTNKLLRALLVNSDMKPISVVANVAYPGPEFSIKVLVGKATEDEKVRFIILAWGPSTDGIITESVPFDFEGTPDSATIPGSAGQRLTQILQTCTGPNRPMPFEPDKGVNLVTVGYGKDAHSLKIWVETVIPEKE